jgi:hypothetical protein
MADQTKEPREPIESLQDTGGPIDAGGPSSHGFSAEIGLGQRLPGPAGQTVVPSVGPDPTATTPFDRYELPKVGGPLRFDVEVATIGEWLGADLSRRRGRAGSFEDDLEVQTAGRVDGAAGRELFSGDAGVGVGALLGPPSALTDELYYKLQADGLPLDWGDVTPTGTRPRVSSVSGGGGAGLPGGVIRVVFNSNMRDHPTLGGVLDPRNYIVTEVATSRRMYVRQVVRVSPTTVDLYGEEVRPYVLTELHLEVKNVEGENGDVIDPAYDEATFSMKGTVYPAGSTLHAFMGLYTGIQSDNASGVDPDVTGPQLIAVDPIAGAGFAGATTNITLKVEDLETGVDQSTIEIDLRRGSGPVEPVWRPAGGGGGAQPGYIVVETPTADGYQYVINPDVDLPDGETITIIGRATNLAPLPEALDDSYWFKIFDKYGFVTVTQTADYELTLDFAEDMQTAGAPGTALLDPASYDIDESVGSGVPIAPTGVTFVNVRQVKLTIPLSTNGERYDVEVVGFLETLGGDGALGAIGEYVADVTLPYVKKVEPLGPTRLRVTFSREMQNNADLVNPEKYRFTEGLFAALVTRTGPDTVEVTTSRQLAGRNYSLRVNP